MNVRSACSYVLISWIYQRQKFLLAYVKVKVVTDFTLSRWLLKGTQAWDNFDFFLPKSNPYMPFVNFREKN